MLRYFGKIFNELLNIIKCQSPTPKLYYNKTLYGALLPGVIKIGTLGVGSNTCTTILYDEKPGLRGSAC